MPPIDTTAAAEIAKIRDILPTSLGSREIRTLIAEDLRARALFAARLTNATVLDEIKRVVDLLAAGEIDHASARVAIMEVLKAVGYTPEGGFPDDLPGRVPPAVKGSLQDLSSKRRIDLILDTQIKILRGRSLQMRGGSAERLAQFPAWELIRVADRDAPRDWPARWEIAGGTYPEFSHRMIALKGSPVWGELGSSGNFQDCLDVDFPPFAFNSGMGWREISRADCEAYGVTGPNGETIDEWLAMDHPVILGTQTGLPAPQGSVAKLDPAIKEIFEKSSGVVIVEETATTPGNKEEILAKIAERRAARAAREKELGRQWIERSEKAYQTQGGAK